MALRKNNYAFKKVTIITQVFDIYMNELYVGNN